MKYRLLTLIALIAVLLAMSGCAKKYRGAQATFHDPNMDFGLIQTVAVLPFENLTGSGGSNAEKVRDVLMTMLQAQVEVYVVPPGEVARAISRVQPELPHAPTSEEAIQLSNNLEVDVLITGALLEFGEVRSGGATANICSLSVNMIDGQSGRIVWGASATRGGIGTGDRLVGAGGQPQNIVIAKAVDDILDRLFQ